MKSVTHIASALALALVLAGCTASGSSSLLAADAPRALPDSGPVQVTWGDPSRFTPEELLVAALAQCHMLWFLHLAAADGVVVLAYTDHARGTMLVEAAGHGQFTEVVLHPAVTLAQGARTPGGDPVDDAHLAALHVRAHETCFIARSVNFPVRCEPVAPTTDASPAVTAADG